MTTATEAKATEEVLTAELLKARGVTKVTASVIKIADLMLGSEKLTVEQIVEQTGVTRSIAFMELGSLVKAGFLSHSEAVREGGKRNGKVIEPGTWELAPEGEKAPPAKASTKTTKGATTGAQADKTEPKAEEKEKPEPKPSRRSQLSPKVLEFMEKHPDEGMAVKTIEDKMGLETHVLASVLHALAKDEQCAIERAEVPMGGRVYKGFIWSSKKAAKLKGAKK